MKRELYLCQLVILAVLGLTLAVEPSCGPNQKFATCKNGCPLSCENLKNPPKICTVRCQSGCNCVNGYVWQGSNCVPVERCPSELIPKCPDNKVYRWLNYSYRKCDGGVVQATLSNCYCKEGYRLNTQTGQCVLQQNCPRVDRPICGPHQKYSNCKTLCPLTCENLKNPPRACTLRCEPGCNCIDGYVWQGRICVPVERCLPLPLVGKCTDDKVHKSSNISYQTCDGTVVKPTVPGCYCKEGYRLNSITGLCVLPQNCPRVEQPLCGPNQKHVQCKNTCPLTCANFKNTPRICTLPCEPGCNCNDGFVWQGQNCVPVERCIEPRFLLPPVPKCIDNHKVYRWSNISYRTCEGEVVKPTLPDCYCKDGYELNFKTGLCVSPQNCPRECGSNQVYVPCKSACPVSCDDYSLPPKPCALLCKPGCECIKDHVLYSTGCVHRSECAELKQKCSGNKVFKSVNIHLVTCDHIHLNPTTPGCYCKDGYVYNRFTGRCIQRNECPKEIRCPVNEELDTSASLCPPTCKNINPIPCSPPIVPITSCSCVWPQVRDEASGKCVAVKDCSVPVCRHPDEEYHACGSTCQPTCSARTRGCTKECSAGCFCKPGFIREFEGGRCIRINECP